MTNVQFMVILGTIYLVPGMHPVIRNIIGAALVIYAIVLLVYDLLK